MTNFSRLNLLLFISFFSIFRPTSAQDVVFKRTNAEEVLPEYTGEVFFDRIDDGFIVTFQKDQTLVGFKNTSNFSNPEYFKVLKSAYNYINFLNSYGTNEERIYIYAKNSKKKFYGIKYNIKTKEKTEKEFDFKLKGQVYLGNFSHKQNFYVLTFIKKSRILKLHIFDLNLNLVTKTVDLEEGTFFLDGELQVRFPPSQVSNPNGNLYDPLFNLGLPISEFKEIKNAQPNSNSSVTKANKLYVIDNTLVLSLENDRDNSALIEINLSDFSSKSKLINKKTIGNQVIAYGEKSNSFLLDNLLFSLRGNKETVAIRINNIDANTTLNSFTIDNKTPYFKEENVVVNNQIILEYGLPQPEKPRDQNIKKRLRKIMKSANDVGLQVVDNDNTYLLTLGGYVLQQGGGFAMPVMGAGFGAIGGLMFSVGYGTFERDESLNFYVDKETLDITYSDFINPYQQMDDFLNEVYDEKAFKKTSWLVKFKIGADYYLGYYDKKSKTYFYRKFN